MPILKKTPLFEDLEFPADNNSVGDLKVNVTAWKRVTDIFKAVPGGVQLFSGSIEPKDIIQGSVGNCWLLASVAALSEHPKIIKRIFRSPRNDDDEPTLSPEGHYVLRFFDIGTGAFVNIDIDDRIPCGANGKPVFARYNGPEAWVMLLEKAMAKYCGSYKDMAGGWSAWAFRTLTGYSCAGFMSWKGYWTPVRPVTKAKEPKFGRMYRERKLLLDSKDKYKQWTLVNRLINWINDDDYDYVFSAGTKGSGDDTQTVKGLFKSHAYSLLVIVPVQPGLTLVQLRNPHGKGEWKGDWCDGDPKWQENEKAAKLADEATADSLNEDDGAFWMHYESDFVEHFLRIDMVRFTRPGKKDEDDNGEEDSEYCSTDEPFDEYGDVDLPDVLPATTEAQIRAQFLRIDKDRDGVISRVEMREYLKNLADARLTPVVITRLLDEADVEKNPSVGITYKEFRGVYGVDSDGEEQGTAGAQREWWARPTTTSEQVAKPGDLARNYHAASAHFK